MAGSEWAETSKRIDDAAAILEAEHPMTIRQLFYRLVSRGLIENSTPHYQRVSRDMTIARKDGRVDWDWIVDRSRPTYTANAWADLAGYGRTIQNSYRRDYWQDQPEYVELWSEKDSVSGSIEDVTNELGITMRAARGFNSTSRVREIAEHLVSIDKPRIVFYIGDHDPAGDCMPREQSDRVSEQMRLLGDRKFFLGYKLAIHKHDIADFNLPPLRIKRDERGNFTDSRSGSFLAKYGDECVELDALPPDELRKRIRDAVTEHIDQGKWKRSVMVEQAEMESIRSVVGAWQQSSD